MLKRVVRLASVTRVNLLVSPLSCVVGTQASRAPGFGVLEVLVVNRQSLWWSVVEKQKKRRMESSCAAAGVLVGVK